MCAVVTGADWGPWGDWSECLCSGIRLKSRECEEYPCDGYSLEEDPCECVPFDAEGTITEQRLNATSKDKISCPYQEQKRVIDCGNTGDFVTG